MNTQSAEGGLQLEATGEYAVGRRRAPVRGNW